MEILPAKYQKLCFVRANISTGKFVVCPLCEDFNTPLQHYWIHHRSLYRPNFLVITFRMMLCVIVSKVVFPGNQVNVEMTLLLTFLQTVKNTLYSFRLFVPFRIPVAICLSVLICVQGCGCLISIQHSISKLGASWVLMQKVATHPLLLRPLYFWWRWFLYKDYGALNLSNNDTLLPGYIFQGIQNHK